MKRIIFAVALVLAMTCILASCSKDTQTPPKPDDLTGIPSVNQEPAADDKDKENKEPEIVLDIKPIEKIDVQELSEAAASLGFENVNFFEAFANAIGVEPSKVTQNDIDKIHYIAVSPEVDGKNSVLVGYIDYVDLCFSDIDQSELMSRLNEVVMASEFEYDIEKDSLSDLAKFKNVELFEIYDVRIDDVSFIKEYNNLAMGYFKNNGITDVSSLSDYNPASLIEIDFTGNEIADWSPLEHIKEKVIYFYDIQSGVTITLDSYLEQIAGNNAAAESETETETQAPDVTDDTKADDSGENKGLVDQDGNPVDFSSLFD